MATLYHTFERSETGRKAIVNRDANGFFVELYKDNVLLESRAAYNHSEAYSEDLAENWVDGLILNPSG